MTTSLQISHYNQQLRLKHFKNGLDISFDVDL